MAIPRERPAVVFFAKPGDGVDDCLLGRRCMSQPARHPIAIDDPQPEIEQDEFGRRR
jgi:hypothetical protein